MRTFVRVATVLGVAYLAAIGLMYAVLVARDREFHRTGSTITGTITALAPVDPDLSVVERRLAPPREYVTATISYSIDGRARTLVQDVPIRRGYAVGDHVTLVHYRAGGNGADDLVAVRGLSLRTLEAMPPFYVGAAGLVAWVGLWRLWPGRRRRRSALQPPRQELGEVT